MREVELVGSHSEPLTRAFIEFKRWASFGDGDAVALSFIFLKAGGYLLSIGREPARARRDIMGSDRTYSPILVGASYIKRFDTRQRALEDLREYKRKHLISPFLFRAAVIKRGAGTAPVLEQVEPVTDIEPLLKFEAEFVDEDTIEPGTSHHSLLTMSQQSESSGRARKQPSLSSLPDAGRQQAADYFRHRARMLERHFPVTIERIRAGRYSEMMSVLREGGVKDWQFDQAASNLLLSASLCNGQIFYPTVSSGEFTKLVAQAIQQREERSDTPELTRFSTNDIMAQVRLDVMALLHAEGQTLSSSSTLDSLQEKLARLNLLEPPNV
jgi:hypothetical protein